VCCDNKITLGVNSPFFNTFGWSKLQVLSFLKRIGVRVFDLWIQSEPEYESIEGFGFDLTPKPATDLDSRPNPKDSVKFNNNKQIHSLFVDFLLQLKILYLAILNCFAFIALAWQESVVFQHTM
jgi:hypothetical protein